MLHYKLFHRRHYGQRDMVYTKRIPYYSARVYKQDVSAVTLCLAYHDTDIKM